jgi:hypothetical protein
MNTCRVEQKDKLIKYMYDNLNHTLQINSSMLTIKNSNICFASASSFFSFIHFSLFAKRASGLVGNVGVAQQPERIEEKPPPILRYPLL